ncbi:CaiB/BaiF CoA transferase family protein [Streptomyces sp. AF1A]|jgi:formyl-CoA transferase|uniref:CaiB/BaiF CoA transferase family protein n=1 Tax=Streptomyces sp. AF1A TaxID=3394350 RepID=UPI0039BC9E5A
MSTAGNQPLSGIRVLDFTQVMLGPSCTQVLGDYGADVIKIEKPGSGDLSRWSINDRLGQDNPVFLSLNRNKRSVALNTRSEEGRKVVLDLVREADVVVSNFRPGVMERLGFGYEELKAVNPRIIWAFGSGFGSTGPYMHKGGQDVLAQAYTGVMARKADPDHPTAIYATALADYSAGMQLVQGILLALLHRERTGTGQKVEVSLYNGLLHMQMQEATMQLMRDRELNWARMPLSGCFPTTDGALVLVGAFKENPLRDICAALDLPDLSQEERFKDLAAQFANRPEIQRILRERFATDTTAHWLARLEERDLLCAPVKNLAEALQDPQTVHNGMLLEFEHPLGETVRTVGSPIAMSEAPTAVRHAPPRLGEHGAQVLAELGYDQARIDQLKDAGVLA